MLTKKGRAAFARLEAKSEAGVAAMIERLSAADQNRLASAMGTIESLLGERAEPKTPYLLRNHQPGDMGWVIHRHAVVYAEEYGWGERFEALVARIAAEFIESFDAKRERCWIAVGGRMHQVRAAGGVSQDDVVDAVDFGRGAGHLSQGWVPRGET